MNYETNARYSTEQEQPSLGDLFSNLSAQASLLFRQEVQLAQAEMTKKATRAGQNAAYVILGAVVAQAAFLTLVAALVLALSTVMDAWLAALLVGVLLAIGAALMVRFGLTKLKEIDPAPRQTIQTMRENKEWLTQQI
ncbi:MAG: phage holin family protein [Candidatus Promineofilum sp.]|uniref:phage holin family protein n=1 Tax=Promineifilum sp. TaxID=2664178 RepID=UPI002411ECEA|nr:phage holin family protein [Promineifilum sp.]MCO5178584.1 phage holin family protein [Promineifilum sp.]